MNTKPLTNKDGKVRELSSKDIRQMKSAAEALPAELAASLPKRKMGPAKKESNT